MRSDKISSYLNSNTLFLCIFIFCLLLHIYNSFIGWNNTILDQHGFRQAQTAISSFYLVKDGLSLNYITPVLGAPWSIPFEFPFFQWMVALIVIIFKTPLDQTGRFVSLAFFYASLFPLFFILGYIIKNISHRLIILTMVLLNPIYMFWSRTFMIESTALFFSLMFAYCAANYLLSQKKTELIWAMTFGALAGITKLTTLICFFPAAYGLFAWILSENNKIKLDKRGLMVFLLYTAAIPLLISLFWTLYANTIRSFNPLAVEMFNSKALSEWMIGTFAQRTSVATWTRLFDNSGVLIPIFGNIITFIISMAIIIINRKRVIEILSCLIFFFAGPVIFTNLFYVHDYYFYANGVFFSIMLGLMVIAFIENRAFKFGTVIALVIMLIITTNLYKAYNSDYYSKQLRDHKEVAGLCSYIKNTTKDTDVILIYGCDWDPSIPYYAQRKALMDRWQLSLSNDKMKRSLNITGKANINAIVVCGNIDNKFIQNKLSYFNLKNKPVYKDSKYTLYAK